jgi:hypothetical protein
MEIWAECFRKRPEDKKRSDSDDIVRILQQLGWERCGRTRVLELPIYGKQRMYRRQVADQAGR